MSDELYRYVYAMHDDERDIFWSDADRTLPFAVYGTLRPGGRLASTWREYADVDPETTRIDDYALFTFERTDGFPWALPTAGESIVVNIVRPRHDAAHDYLLRRFDFIEGHPYMYVRTEAITVDGDLVWLYVANSEHMGRDHPVPGNDWSVYLPTDTERLG